MKLDKQALKRIIKEELDIVLNETASSHEEKVATLILSGNDDQYEQAMQLMDYVDSEAVMSAVYKRFSEADVHESVRDRLAAKLSFLLDYDSRSKTAGDKESVLQVNSQDALHAIYYPAIEAIMEATGFSDSFLLDIGVLDNVAAGKSFDLSSQAQTFKKVIFKALLEVPYVETFSAQEIHLSDAFLKNK